MKVNFKKLAGGEGANTPKRMEAYKENGFDIIKYFTKLDKKRTLTRIGKQNLAVRDDWTTNEGVSYEPETLFDGEYDAGHIVSHADGGKTTEENMVIENASVNRSKKRETTKITKN